MRGSRRGTHDQYVTLNGGCGIPPLRMAVSPSADAHQLTPSMRPLQFADVVAEGADLVGVDDAVSFVLVHSTRIADPVARPARPGTRRGHALPHPTL